MNTVNKILNFFHFSATVISVKVSIVSSYQRRKESERKVFSTSEFIQMMLLLSKVSEFRKSYPPSFGWMNPCPGWDGAGFATPAQKEIVSWGWVCLRCLSLKWEGMAGVT